MYRPLCWTTWPERVGWHDPYSWDERMFTEGGRGAKRTFIRMELIAGFFTYMTLAEGKDMDAVKAKWNAVSPGMMVSVGEKTDASLSRIR